MTSTRALFFCQAIDQLRKLSLLGFVACLKAGSVEQAFAASFVSLGWLMLHVRIRPYRRVQAPPHACLPPTLRLFDASPLCHRAGLQKTTRYKRAQSLQYFAPS